MHSITRFLLSLAVFLCTSLAVERASGQTSVTVRVGTLGAGVQIAQRVTPVVSIRGGVSYLPSTPLPDYTLDRSDLDVAFGGDATLSSWSLLVDVHPPFVGLRISGGIVTLGSSLEARGRPLESYTVGSVTYTPEELGMVSAEVSYASRLSPYLGLGFGRPPASRGVGFHADFGVVFAGPPDFELTSTTPVLPTPEQVRRTREILDRITIYPVIALGVSFGL